MQYPKSLLLLISLAAILISCKQTIHPETKITTAKSTKSDSAVFNRGIDTTGFYQMVHFQKDQPEFNNLIIENDAFKSSLEKQINHLNSSYFRKQSLNDTVAITRKNLLETSKILSKFDELGSTTVEEFINQHFNLYRLSGNDSLGNVLFTGYFTPVMKVRSVRDSIYKYPFYKYPGRRRGMPLPERSAIDFQNILKGKGLEIAWSNNLFDNFTLQVQGSGIVEFEDNTRKILAYNGKNGYPYTSIGKHLIELGEITKENISLSAIRNWLTANPHRVKEILSINKSYVFFKLKEPTPIGAASVPLTADYSVAVDTDIIPMGSTLLAEVPVLDENDKFLKHEYRILFAQDRGGAIKGTGRIDLYCGIGDRGIKKANSLNHYGRIWLLEAREVN
ncbi:MAG: murein transglycosylase A [Bacteroidota bacterium]